MLERFLSSLTDIIWPKTCLACKDKLNNPSKDDLVCGKCWDDIKRNVPPFCNFCGRRLLKPHITKSVCPDCLRKNFYFDAAFSPCAYSGVIKELIHAFKYNDRAHLGKPLSRLMVDFIKEFSLPIGYVDLLVPVPLHKTRLREREFNQAEVLGNHVAKEFGKVMLTDTLARTRPTRTQTGLESTGRFLNVMGSFSVVKSEQVRNKSILLIDDVLTTGATSSEAARTLKGAGANIVFVLTLAS